MTILILGGPLDRPKIGFNSILHDADLNLRMWYSSIDVVSNNKMIERKKRKKHNIQLTKQTMNL